MNRMELAERIIAEGKKRKITITECRIYDRGNYLEFHPTIKNNHRNGWVYEHQVEEIIDDLAPIERPHKTGRVGLDTRYFKVGEIVEIDNLWIRLDAGEDTPEEFINIGSVCGQWRQGWIKGEVVETPEQNDRALVVKFTRDIYVWKGDSEWVGDVNNLEKLVREGRIVKIEKGQPIYCGTGTWSVRYP